MVHAGGISQFIARYIKNTIIKIPIVSEGSNETTLQKSRDGYFLETPYIFP
jgi:hypothetical protein